MRIVHRISMAFGALLLAACSRSPAVDEDMKKDLDAASAASVEMAPRTQGTTVVSPLEQKRPTQPVKAPVRQVRAPARTKQPETPQTVQSGEPAAVAPAPQPAPPRVQPPPPGGYKSVNEVIRNAPFPIKPATRTKRPA